MTEEQLHIVQEINTSDLCSIISSRNSSLEDEIRRLKNENKLIGERCNQLLADKGKLTDENMELKVKIGLSIECEKAQKDGELCLGYAADEDEPCERCKNCIKCECGYYQLGETEKDNQLNKAKEIMNIAIEGIKYWGIVGGNERPFIKKIDETRKDVPSFNDFLKMELNLSDEKIKSINRTMQSEDFKEMMKKLNPKDPMIKNLLRIADIIKNYPKE